MFLLNILATFKSKIFLADQWNNLNFSLNFVFTFVLIRQDKRYIKMSVQVSEPAKMEKIMKPAENDAENSEDDETQLADGASKNPLDGDAAKKKKKKKKKPSANPAVAPADVKIEANLEELKLVEKKEDDNEDEEEDDEGAGGSSVAGAAKKKKKKKNKKKVNIKSWSVETCPRVSQPQVKSQQSSNIRKVNI